MEKIAEFTITIEELNVVAVFTKESIDYLVFQCCSDYCEDYRHGDENKYRSRFGDGVFITEFTKTEMLKIKKYHNQTIQIFRMPNYRKHCIVKSDSKIIIIRDKIEKCLICWILQSAVCSLIY